MRYLMLTALLSTALAAAVWAAKDQPVTKPATQPSGAPINKFCAIEKENEVDPKVTTTYEGKVIGFCCKDCIKDFEKNPKKYMETLK